MSPAKEEEDFIYLFIIDLFSEDIHIKDYTSSIIKEYWRERNGEGNNRILIWRTVP